MSEFRDPMEYIMEGYGHDPEFPNLLDQFVESIFKCWRNGWRIYIFGNGGSTSLANHFATDLWKAGLEVGWPVQDP